MAKAFLLKGEIREHTGTKHAGHIRQSKRIPTVVYGHKQEPVSISLDSHNLVEALHHGNRIFDIEVGKKKETTMIKAIQYDHLGRDIIHVDMMRVSASERVKVAVPKKINHQQKEALKRYIEASGEKIDESSTFFKKVFGK